MKKLLSLMPAIVIPILLHAQSSVDIKFLYNGRTINLSKELVNFSVRDTLQIMFQSKELISVDEIRVQPLFAKFPDYNPKQQEQQTQQKVKLVIGDYKNFKGFSKQKKYVIKIPIRSFSGSNLSKLKINILNCTNQKGEKLIRNNKVYEIFSSLAAKATL